MAHEAAAEVQAAADEESVAADEGAIVAQAAAEKANQAAEKAKAEAEKKTVAEKKAAATPSEMVVGTKVWAKMKGHPHWPAKVCSRGCVPYTAHLYAD